MVEYYVQRQSQIKATKDIKGLNRLYIRHIYGSVEKCISSVIATDSVDKIYDFITGSVLSIVGSLNPDFKVVLSEGLTSEIRIMVKNNGKWIPCMTLLLLKVFGHHTISRM